MEEQLTRPIKYTIIFVYKLSFSFSPLFYEQFLARDYNSYHFAYLGQGQDKLRLMKHHDRLETQLNFIDFYLIVSAAVRENQSSRLQTRDIRCHLLTVQTFLSMKPKETAKFSPMSKSLVRIICTFLLFLLLYCLTHHLEFDFFLTSSKNNTNSNGRKH